MSDLPALHTSTGLTVGDNCEVQARMLDGLIEVELTGRGGDVNMTLTRHSAETLYIALRGLLRE